MTNFSQAMMTSDNDDQIGLPGTNESKYQPPSVFWFSEADRDAAIQAEVVGGERATRRPCTDGRGGYIVMVDHPPSHRERVDACDHDPGEGRWPCHLDPGHSGPHECRAFAN